MINIIQQLQEFIVKDNPVILEIGSHKGEDTIKFLDVFKNIQLFCFEPDPENCNHHRKLITDERCLLFEMAIAEKNGTIIFHRSAGLGRRASGSINKPTGHLWMHKWCLFEEDIKIPCMTIDEWRRQNNIENIDLIWADVNGAEAKMIAGATETLKHTRYLYTEFQHCMPEIYEGGIGKKRLQELLPNFQEILVHKNNILFVNKEFGHDKISNT